MGVCFVFASLYGHYGKIMPSNYNVANQLIGGAVNWLKEQAMKQY